MSYESISSQGRMAFDAVRNEAYWAALARVVTPDSVVLDLGAGTGILGLLAARLGAKRVYLVDPSPIMTLTRDIVAANHLEDRVICLAGRLSDVEIPEKVDVIVSVMTGNFLLTEDLLPVLFEARDRHLKPGGHLIPDAAVMEVAPVSSPGMHARHVGLWSTMQHDVDLSACRLSAANSVHYLPDPLPEFRFLTDPTPILEMDFMTAAYEPLHATVEPTATESGECHGLSGWFKMRLGDQWLTTSPTAPRLHWSPAYLPVDPPLHIERGSTIAIALDRQPKGDWSWRVRAGGDVRRHSTMLGAAVTPALLDRASAQYVPAATPDLVASAFVLSQVDGLSNVSVLAKALCDRFPSQFADEATALEFVQLTVARF
ncbi:MAG: class I SAM-dependent methyltransferase [Vicinamibacterales bacterium]